MTVASIADPLTLLNLWETSSSPITEIRNSINTIANGSMEGTNTALRVRTISGGTSLDPLANYDLDADGISAANRDFSDDDSFLIFHGHQQNAQNTEKWETIANDGLFCQIFQAGTTNGVKFTLGGIDTSPPDEAWVTYLINPRQNTTGTDIVSGIGAADDIDNIRIGHFALTNNFNYLWGRCFRMQRPKVVGGDGGDADGTIDTLFDDQADPVDPLTDGLARYMAIVGGKIMRMMLNWGIGNGGTNDTVFTDADWTLAYPAQAAGVSMQIHVLDDDLGCRINAGSSDVINLTGFVITGELTHHFITEGSDSATVNITSTTIINAETFETAPNTTWDGCTIEGNQTMVFT